MQDFSCENVMYAILERKNPPTNYDALVSSRKNQALCAIPQVTSLTPGGILHATLNPVYLILDLVN